MNAREGDHGVGLVQRVIDALGAPLASEPPAATTFPSGRSRPPSLRRWIELDTGPLVNDPLYGERMRQHAGFWFGGHTSSEYPWLR